MLTQLVIQKFALIDVLTIDFAAGFNVLTGETGAGKSILIDAFGAVLGGRLSAGQIRQGADACLVQAVFDLHGEPALCAEIAELSNVLLDDGQLLLVRRYSRNGRSLSSINGVQVPLTLLRQVGERLVEIHGQHDNQRLLKPAGYLAILDAYAAEALAEPATLYRKTYQQWRALLQKLQQAQREEAERERRLDMLRWQTKEIKEAALSEKEEAALQLESVRMANWEKNTRLLQEALGLLDGEENGGVVASMQALQQVISRIGRVEQSFVSFSSPLKDAAYLLEEVREACVRYAESAEFDPVRAEKVGERLDLYYRLKRKYGPETTQVLQFLASAEQELQGLDDAAENIAAWQKQAQHLESDLRQQAGRLTTLRSAAAELFGREVTAELQALAMPAAVFSVQLIEQETLGADGCDQVDFRFSANAGMAPQELAKVASGGELSRIALAFKRILVAMQALSVTVFDEIDSGVGGLTALKMAEQIAAVAVGRQVLCVTHLPQIACMADRQLVIEKKTVAGSTVTTVHPVSDDARVQEIVRMIAGEQSSAAAAEAAREMLREAKAKKGR